MYFIMQNLINKVKQELWKERNQLNLDHKEREREEIAESIINENMKNMSKRVLVRHIDP